MFDSVGIERDDSSARAIATKDSCKKVAEEEYEEGKSQKEVLLVLLAGEKKVVVRRGERKTSSSLLYFSLAAQGASSKMPKSKRQKIKSKSVVFASLHASFASCPSKPKNLGITLQALVYALNF